MNPIEAAILRTILYADVFRFAMTVEEIHHFIIHDEALSLTAVTSALQNSHHLRRALCFADGYIALAEHKDYIALRIAREKIANQQWASATKYGIWLSYLPFIEMVTMTGALAMHNPTDIHDDFDYMLITKPGRVWLARAFAIMLVRLARLRGIQLCPNYVLASDQLIQQRQDLFIAHEIAQMIPLTGHHVYRQMREVNRWTDLFLPNAQSPFYGTDSALAHGWQQWIKRGVERLLSGRFGQLLENWEYRRKVKRFAQEAARPEASAQIDISQVKGHFQDYGHPALEQYHTRLQKHYLDVNSLSMSGD